MAPTLSFEKVTQRLELVLKRIFSGKKPFSETVGLKAAVPIPAEQPSHWAFSCHHFFSLAAYLLVRVKPATGGRGQAFISHLPSSPLRLVLLSALKMAAQT